MKPRQINLDTSVLLGLSQIKKVSGLDSQASELARVLSKVGVEVPPSPAGSADMAIESQLGPHLDKIGEITDA